MEDGRSLSNLEVWATTSCGRSEANTERRGLLLLAEMGFSLRTDGSFQQVRRGPVGETGARKNGARELPPVRERSY